MALIRLARAFCDALEEFQLSSKNNRSKITAVIRDGCSTNCKAVQMIRDFGFNHIMDMKCISHASNNIGKLLHKSCRKATVFIEKFNTLMNRSEKGRRNFTVLIEEEVKRFSSDIRWFYRQSVASQIFNKWNHVRSLINDEEIYALNLKDKLKLMIRDNEHDILIELALLEDIASVLAQLCYYQEGDAFLVPTTFQHWQNTMQLLKDCIDQRVQLPHLCHTLQNLYQDHNEIQLLTIQTLEKIKPCYHKMVDDTTARLKGSLSILRACRLFDYRFIATNPLMSLYTRDHNGDESGELFQLCHLPSYSEERHLNQFKDEVQLYHSYAVSENSKGENDRPGVLDFWKLHKLNLPVFSGVVQLLGT